MYLRKCAAALAVMLFTGAVFTVHSQSTTFNYQGSLKTSGSPANGDFDFELLLFNAASGGAQVGTTQFRGGVVVADGIFSVNLDFGDQFPGASRFLEIRVKPTGGGGFTVLAPRQPIASTPYAIKSLNSDNASQLGGVAANQYLQTNGSGTPNSIPVWVDGTTLGSSMITQSGAGVQMPNNVQLAAGAQGNNMQFGSPNGETGVIFSGAIGRSDIRFDGSTLRLVAGSPGGPPSANNGIAISSVGNVGIGFTNPASKLHVLSTAGGISAIFGENAAGPGVQGLSSSSWGVSGKSTTNRGVYGESVSGTGVSGLSTSGSGVYGETAIASPVAAGVYGKGTGNDSLGVIGESNTGNNAVGVYGVTSSLNGFAVFARNHAPGGRALYADGNVAQGVSNNGLVKAMIKVDINGLIIGCYNGITNSSSGNCGFVMTQPIAGVFRINFGFAIASRFVSVTGEYCGDCVDGNSNNTGVNYRYFDPNSFEVFTFATNTENLNPRGFMLILY